MATYPSTEKERVTFWKRRIEYAVSQVKPYWESGRRLIRQFNNEPNTIRERFLEQTEDDPLLARIKANLVFGWLDQSTANLIEHNPTFTVSPMTAASREFSPAVAQVSNYYYQETDQLRQDERILLDAFLMPYGVKKLGWTSDLDRRVAEFFETPEYDFGDDVDAENMFMMTGEPVAVRPEQDHAFHIEAHTIAFQQPGQNVEVSQMLERHIKLHDRMMNRPEPDAHADIRWESPFGVRWPPDMFVVDPFAQDGIRDAQFIAFQWKKPIDDVRANPNYKNTQDLEPGQASRPPGAPPVEKDIKEDDFGFITGWEIWARNFPVSNNERRDLLLVLAEEHDQFLREDDEWPYRNIEDYPVELLVLQHSPERWYTKPSLSLAGGDNIQALANEILDSFLSIARKEKNLILYDPDVITEDGEIDNILAAPDMSAFPIRGLSKVGSNAVVPIQLGKMNTEKNNLLQQVIGLFDRAAGTPQPGVVDIDTATEASIAERRTTAREGRRGNLLSAFQIRVARKFWQLACQYRPENLPLIHPDAEAAVEITEEMAKGEYRFRMDIRSHAQAVALERKQWQDLLNLAAGLAGQFTEIYQQPPNLAKLFERVLRRGYEETSPEEILPMLVNMQDQRPASPAQMGQTAQMLQPTPMRPKTGGPSLMGPPTEVESENATGPALPRQFNKPAPNNNNIMGTGQTS